MQRPQRHEVHPDNPQVRVLQSVSQRLRAGAVAAVPTAAGYLMACRLDDKAAANRLLRQVNDRQPVALLCHDLAQAAAHLQIDDRAFRAIREKQPGAAAFLLRCSHRVPRRLAAAAGGASLLYFPGHPACQGLLEQLEQPLLAWLPPEGGVPDLEELAAPQRALLDLTLDAGPLLQPEALEFVELVPSSRPRLGLGLYRQAEEAGLSAMSA